MFQFKYLNPSKKYNFVIFHERDVHTSPHLHKNKTVWRERQTGEEEKLPSTVYFSKF